MNNVVYGEKINDRADNFIDIDLITNNGVFFIQTERRTLTFIEINLQTNRLNLKSQKQVTVQPLNYFT